MDNDSSLKITTSSIMEHDDDDIYDDIHVDVSTATSGDNLLIIGDNVKDYNEMNAPIEDVPQTIDDSPVELNSQPSLNDEHDSDFESDCPLSQLIDSSAISEGMPTVETKSNNDPFRMMEFDDDEDDEHEINQPCESFDVDDVIDDHKETPPPNVQICPETSTITSNTTTIFLNSKSPTCSFHTDDVDNEEDDDEDQVNRQLDDLDELDDEFNMMTHSNKFSHHPMDQEDVENNSIDAHSTLSSTNSSMSSTTTMSSNDDNKKRLRLEDFMRQIITQINTSSEKIWPNLLLDFTKNFSELNIPNYVLQMNSSNLSHLSPGAGSSSNVNGQHPNRLVSNSDQDLLMDILNIAISSLAMPQTDRRVFACQLLLNIHDCLTMDTIESKVMPLLNDLVKNETTTSVRFTVCFVLANYARRVEFEYFRSTIFPMFQKLSSIALLANNADSTTTTNSADLNHSLCTATTICFALLDSLTSLLSYLLHFNQMLLKKRQQDREQRRQLRLHKHKPQKDEDEDMTNDQGNQTNSNNMMNEVFAFIKNQFLPLLKKTFQSMLHYIEQYRSMSIKIEQDLFNCFLHWRDQIGTHDSISQTLFSHYQSLILFVLILRDYLQSSQTSTSHDENLSFDDDDDDDDSFLIDPDLCRQLDEDHWYLDYYYQLCAFHYVMPKPLQPVASTTTTSTPSGVIIDQSSAAHQSILTKINLMDLGKSITTTKTTNSTTTSTATTTTTTTTTNFIERYQVTEGTGSSGKPTTTTNAGLPTTSILQQHLQQPMNTASATSSTADSSSSSGGAGATNVTIQNNDFSIGSTQYTFSSNALNNLDIFGFFHYKTIACKITLVALVPAISDLYYITKNSNQLFQQQKHLLLHQKTKLNFEQISKKTQLTTPVSNDQLPPPPDLLLLTPNSDQEKSEPTQAADLPASPAPEDKEQIISRLIDILNKLSIDNNYEIAIKMANIIEKLVERFTDPIRLYSLLTNVLQSQNFDVITQIIKNFFNVFSSMLSLSRNNDETKTIIEYVVETFLRSETYLSTKPKWRLHIQYFDVMFRLAQIIPVEVVKRQIMPRLLLRFSTTRPIPCRQAVARCLIFVYLENFAQYDFDKLRSVAEQHQNQQPIESELTAAYLSFDLFNWLDRNLKQSQKYQDRQIYVDIIFILIRLLFRDSIEWPEQNSEPNHYMVDLQELCPSLLDNQKLLFRYSYHSNCSLKNLHPSQLFCMMLVQKYRLLHQMTEMCTKDRVSTIRASSCIVLYYLLQCTNLWVVNNLHRLSEHEPEQQSQQLSSLSDDDVSYLETIVDYYDSYMENNSETDSSSNSSPSSSSTGSSSSSCSVSSSSTITTTSGSITPTISSPSSQQQFNSEQLFRRLQTEPDRIVMSELNKVFLLADDYRLDFNLNYYQMRKNKRKKPRTGTLDGEELLSSPGTTAASTTTLKQPTHPPCQAREVEAEFVVPLKIPPTTMVSANVTYQDGMLIDCSVRELVDELLTHVENMNMTTGSSSSEDEGIDPDVCEDYPDDHPNCEDSKNNNSIQQRRGLIYICNSNLIQSNTSGENDEKQETRSKPTETSKSPLPSTSSTKSVQISPKKRKSPKSSPNNSNQWPTIHQQQLPYYYQQQHSYQKSGHSTSYHHHPNTTAISGIITNNNGSTNKSIIHHNKNQNSLTSSPLFFSSSSLPPPNKIINNNRLQNHPLLTTSGTKILSAQSAFSRYNKNQKPTTTSPSNNNNHLYYHRTMRKTNQSPQLKPGATTTNTALLPTPPSTSSSKVPIYNNINPSMQTANSNSVSGPTYPGLCLRLVYPPTPPPPPPHSGKSVGLFNSNNDLLSAANSTGNTSQHVLSPGVVQSGPLIHHQYPLPPPPPLNNHHQASKLPMKNSSGTSSSKQQHNRVLTSTGSMATMVATSKSSKLNIHPNANQQRSMSVPPNVVLYQPSMSSHQKNPNKNNDNRRYSSTSMLTNTRMLNPDHIPSSNHRYHYSSTSVNYNNNNNSTLTSSMSTSNNNNYIRMNKKFKKKYDNGANKKNQTTSPSSNNNNQQQPMETDDDGLDPGQTRGNTGITEPSNLDTNNNTPTTTGGAN